MPRAKKEIETTSTVKKAAAKKSETKSKKTTQTTSAKKTPEKTSKAEPRKKSTTSSAKSTSAKKTTKASSTKVATKKAVKSNVTKKVSTTSKVTKKSTKKASTEVKENRFINILEYYDLPYRYNETVVKILAQTPKVLFVYWDISDDDRKKYIEKYGEYYFNDSYPVLLVHNNTLNYTEEIEINDFANSWYISIPDSRCEYSVTLARRFKEYAKRNPDMKHKEDINSAVFVVSSNNLIMPNDHVLLDELKPNIKYRNVKTNEENYKSISHILKDNNLLDFYNLYQKIYQVEDLSNVFSLCNPSSGNPTSTFK